MTHSILVVDDEPHIREVIAFACDHAGMKTAQARDGREALAAVRRGGIDLVVLDVGMPGMDGLEVCRQIRRSSDLPILFLSARDEEIDRVLGLEIGGDDYVTKPFSPRELVARIRSILKRSVPAREAAETPPLASGPLALDRRSRTVTCGGVGIALTALEFSILEALLARPGMVFSRERLMEAAYGAGRYVADRTIDSHIRNIRAKFPAPDGAGLIVTVHGVGFKLAAAAGRA